MKRYEQDDYDDPSGEDNRVALRSQAALIGSAVIAFVLFIIYLIK